MKPKERVSGTGEVLVFVLTVLLFYRVLCVECTVKPTGLKSTTLDKITNYPEMKATSINAKRSTSAFRSFTPKPTLLTKYSGALMDKPEASMEVSEIAEWIAETTESLTDMSKASSRIFGTSQPRHPRSTIPGRASKVFLDSTFSDYSLSWITKDNARVKKTDDEDSDEVVESGSGGVNPAYTWTPSASSFPSSLSHTPSLGADSNNHHIPVNSVGDLMLALPTRTTSGRTVPCCPWEPSVSELTASHEGQVYGRPTASHLRRKLEPKDEEGVLYIGGIFDLTKNPNAESARSELDAALLAIRHVNQKRVVPGYRLQLVYNDSQCDAGVGTDVFYDMIYRMAPGRHITMVMGSACAEVTKTLAEIVPYWNLILISYATTSPALGDREKYKTFFRLALADSALVPARRMFINAMGWKTVAVLYEDVEKYSLAMNAIGEDFAFNNITISASLAFKDAALEVPEQLQELKSLDVRIILAAFSVATARQVFCEAYHQGLYGPRYVWLLMGGFKLESWWQDARDTNCTAHQLATALNGCFAVVSLNTLLGGLKSVANLTTTEFIEAYRASNGSQPMSFFAATTYDTVWTIALTLGAAISQWREANRTVPPPHAMNYSRDTYINIIQDSHFNGVSGPVSFAGSDREGVSVIYQLQGGNFSRVAIHYPDSPDLDFDCDGCRPIVWQGGRIPRDKKIVVPRQKTIDAAIFYISTACCGAGILLALVFLQYNLYHRKLKYIKLSSPKLNNVAVVGCILVYGTVVLMGLDDRTMPPDVFSVVCTVKVFLLAAGFSLAFGAMFAKTFRVHQIFTRAHHGLVKSKLLRDRHLLFLIGGLMVLDSGVVCVWIIVDPMRRHVTNLTMESSKEDEDLVFLTQLATCHSEHLQKWMGTFYAYKGLLLLFGVYMAWETRNVKIPALNDSQYIGFNVYNVVLMSVCVVVLSSILSSQPTLSYAIESAFMVVSTTVTLCLLFVPKIYVIVTSGGDPVIASTGILVEAKTRRFVVDEKKEIYYRAEVQNRVYKRELVELDQEISRLERLLEMPMEDYPKLTEELLFLLPESKVDGTPAFQRRRNKEFERCNSISDGGEGVSYGKEETEDMLRELKLGLDPSPVDGKPRLNSHPPFGKRFSAHEPEPESTFKKLRRLSHSLSIGHSSHCKWKARGAAKTGISDKPENHHCLPGDSRRKDSSAAAFEGDDVSMSFSSPPLSPMDFEKDKSRFAALLAEELAGNSEVWLSRGRANLLEAEPVDYCPRPRSFSTSTGHDHAPTIDKVTQTSFAESPLTSKKRLGHVYRVDRLEVIELEENPGHCPSSQSSSLSPGHVTVSDQSSSLSPCHVTVSDQSSVLSPCFVTVNNQSSSGTETADGLDADKRSDPTAPSSSGAGGDGNQCLAQSVRGQEKTTFRSRPDSFPEKLGSRSLGSRSPGSRSPALRRGIAVHFSPYNEIRFVDKRDTSDTFLQEAVDTSPTGAYHNRPSPHVPSEPTRTDSQSLTSTQNLVTSSNTKPVSSRERTASPGSSSSTGGGVDSDQTRNPPTSTLRNYTQTIIDNERRKRIRKLQHDLQRIQRELEDLDDLEYDVSEV